MISNKYFRYALICLPALLLPVGPMLASADQAATVDWSGIWKADTDDMLFTLRVISDGEQFRVEEVTPTGMGWQARYGAVSGQSGTISVNYQGVSAQVLVQLTSADVAMVRSLSCQPDYHVVCTLVRNQQARFVRMQDD